MKVTVAATQMACGWNREENIGKAVGIIKKVAQAGANIVLPQEMFSMHFFGFMDWKSEYFAYAETVDGPTVTHMAEVAKQLGIVIPVNFFECANNAYYNTTVIIDADGRKLGIYRKTHIPVGPPGCYEKVYTSPSDTGFKAWKTAYGTIGCGICWDSGFRNRPASCACLARRFCFIPPASARIATITGSV